MPTINDLSYGRSVSGRTTFVNNYTAWVDSTKRTVRGNEYSALIKAINNGWSGSDADAFIAKLDKLAKQLEERISIYASRMNSAMNSDASDFANMQNVNANSINNIRF